MIRYLHGHELDAYPALRDSMFRDRAKQFAERLGWAVQVDGQGLERDQYDNLDPLYVIWQRSDGRHGGSMRFLPTVGRTMVNEHFLHLTDGEPIVSPLIWECTRFCLAPQSPPRVAAALMLAGGEIMCNFGIRHFVGVFDARMVRIYNRIGAAPEVLGSEGEGSARISVGLWEFAQAAKARVMRSSGISAALSRHWFERAFGAAEGLAATA